MDNEKDLYIRKKLQEDQLISKKADNVFNEFLRGEFNMDKESVSNTQTDTKDKKINKFKNKVKKAIAGIASAIVAFGAANVYATSKGYDNIFFMIKYMWDNDSSITIKKDDILVDRDITISYDKIAINDNIMVAVEKLQTVNNNTKLYLRVFAKEEVSDKGLKYVVYNENDQELCSDSSENKIYTHEKELKLNGFKDTDNIIKIKLFEKGTSENELVKMVVNLKDRTIEVENEKEAISKISEAEIKDYLGSISLLINDKGEMTKSQSTNKITVICYDIIDLNYCNGFYTVTYTYSKLDDNYTNGENDASDYDIYQNTIVFSFDDSQKNYLDKFNFISSEVPFIISNKDDTEIEEDYINDAGLIDYLTPSGWAGSSNYRLCLYKGGYAYVITYDGAGYKNNNIVKKELVAYNIDEIVNDTIYEKLFVVGKNLKITDAYKNYKWLGMSSAKLGYLDDEDDSTGSEPSNAPNSGSNTGIENTHYKVNVLKVIPDSTAATLCTYYKDTYYNNVTNTTQDIQMKFGSNGESTGIFYVLKNREVVVNIRSVSDEYEFTGWYLDRKFVSNELEYKFFPVNDCMIEARFQKKSGVKAELVPPTEWTNGGFYKLVLFDNGDAYVYTYDNRGVEGGNIIKKELVAKNIEQLNTHSIEKKLFVVGMKLEQMEAYQNYKNWLWMSSGYITDN